MQILGVIPARYASSRLPAKALKNIAGKTMIRRVYEQASKAKTFAKVLVATDHQEIYDEVKSFGGEVMMTAAHHNNGTERCKEVVETLSDKFDYVVNIQGDEPFIQPEQLETVCSILDGNTQLATLVAKIKKSEQLFINSIMKVVFDKNYNALYFSRECIPHLRDVPKEEWIEKGTFYKHVAIYAYRTDILNEIAGLPLSPLEKSESLEQLRWLENGYQIKLGITDLESMSVDTPDDLEKARKFAIDNNLTK
ncbi:MAG: 3-deoxy-manno-octulosonate cytidylyltransferase [Thalassobius sp.]|nr:3-deoxy-manno-octulosonate cytidylyltransferase [Thalassovita sp.]